MSNSSPSTVKLPKSIVGSHLAEYLRMVPDAPYTSALRRLVSKEGGTECDLEDAIALATALLRRVCLEATWTERNGCMELAYDTSKLLGALRSLADPSPEPKPKSKPSKERPEDAKNCVIVLKPISLTPDASGFKKKAREGTQRAAMIHECTVCGWQSKPLVNRKDWSRKPVRVCGTKDSNGD